MAPALRGEYQSAILFGRARYTARADRTLRFYREQGRCGPQW
jgi:5-methylthioadenosine/S-adenosylhomocysteine deaminase